jgi:putative transposase
VVERYTKGSHTLYHHRYHLVWITKYRYRVLRGELQRRVRTIIAQVAEESGVKILNGVVSSDHIHLLVSIPPHLSVSEFIKRAKGRSSRKVQQEFPELRKRYWGQHFWARGYFSATSGNVIDEMIDEYINNHYDAHKQNGEENISLE